jgi:hypothetical protein
MNGTHDFAQMMLKHNFTKDDMKFLLREVKKNFAEGNYEWTCLTELAAAMQKGDVIKPLYPSAHSDAPDTPDEAKSKPEDKDIV